MASTFKGFAVVGVIAKLEAGTKLQLAIPQHKYMLHHRSSVMYYIII